MKRIQIGPSSYLSSACLLKKLIPSWKRCKTVTLKTDRVEPILSNNLETSDRLWFWYDGVDLVWGLCLFHQTSRDQDCHLILISFILIKQQRSLTDTRSSLSNCVNSIGNGLYIGSPWWSSEGWLWSGIGGNTSNQRLANVPCLLPTSESEFQIVGTGVSGWSRSFEHILCGAGMGANRNDAA